MKINPIKFFGPGLIILALPVLATQNELSDSDKHTIQNQQQVSVLCNIQRAFQHGAAGESYPDTCRLESNKDSVFAYESGQHVFELRNDLSDLEQSLASRQHDLNSVQSATYELEARLIVNPPPPSQRLHALLKLTKLDQQKANIEAEIVWLQFERDYRQTLRTNLELSYSKS